MSAKGNNIGTNAPDLKLLAELNTMLGLSAIKAAFSPQHQTMPQSLAQIAYEAYCESRNWTSLNGQHLPPWHDQSPDLKAAWVAAADALAASLSLEGATTPARTPRG